MKKNILYIIFLLLTTSVSAQSLSDIKEVTFFGVDYSKVKVLATRETPEAFKEAFKNINKLFFTEPDKYKRELEFRLNMKVSEIRLDSTLARISKMSTDENNFFALSNQTVFDQNYFSESIKDLNSTNASKTGIFIIAKMLDKGNKTGHYEFIFFNTSTKEIIDHFGITGKIKSRSFGLRNYWANSLIHAISGINLKKRLKEQNTK